MGTCMPHDNSVLVSIPKDPRGSLTNSANYRAIALYSSMGKIVDMLISDRHSNQQMHNLLLRSVVRLACVLRW